MIHDQVGLTSVYSLYSVNISTDVVNQDRLVTAHELSCYVFVCCAVLD